MSKEGDYLRECSGERALGAARLQISLCSRGAFLRRHHRSPSRASAWKLFHCVAVTFTNATLEPGHAASRDYSPYHCTDRRLAGIRRHSRYGGRSRQDHICGRTCAVLRLAYFWRAARQFWAPSVAFPRRIKADAVALKVERGGQGPDPEQAKKLQHSKQNVL
jgi:hypothetical protein